MVDGDAHSELLSADWNQEWMRLQAARHRADDSFEWDKRARHFRPLETAPYARDFIKLLALKPGESVLDMGCGAGSIAIPLAQDGHPVIAADFSPAMLGTLDAGIEYYGLEDLITPLELAWDDDWAGRESGRCCLCQSLCHHDQPKRRACQARPHGSSALCRHDGRQLQPAL